MLFNANRRGWGLGIGWVFVLGLSIYVVLGCCNSGYLIGLIDLCRRCSIMVMAY